MVPNTLVPGLRGLDWAAMDKMFSHCLSVPIESHTTGCALNILDADETARPDLLEFDQEDVTLKNLEGPGALEAAERWAESRKMVRTLETLRVYLTGRPRAFVDSVLNKHGKGGGSAVSAAMDLASTGLRVGSWNAGQSRRYGASDDDTDDSDAENERARTAHKLFADEADLEAHSGWYSPSQSLDEGVVVLALDGEKQKLSASPDRGHQARLLTPVSSPARKIGSRNKRYKRQVDHDYVMSTGQPSPLELNSPIQLSGQRHSIALSTPDTSGREASGGDPFHIPEPLADLNNFLANRQPSHSSSSRQSTPSNSPQSAPKRRRLTLENLAMKERSSRDRPNPTHDRSMPILRAHGGSTDGRPERSMKMIATVDPSFAPTNQSSSCAHGTLLALTPRLPFHSNTFSSFHTGRSPSISAKTASTSPSIATQTERLRIADKLSRARPDLVAPSYVSKRARQLSRSLKSETQKQYLRGLRSISTANSANTSMRGSVSHDSLLLEDVPDDGMDWNRSRLLTEMVKSQLDGGEQVTLPLLACLDSQGT